MRYLAAYLLSALGGNENPDAAAITKILTAAGVEVDAEKVAKVVASCEGKSLDELIAAGTKKLPSGGGGGGAAAAAAPKAGAAAAAAPAAKAPEPEPEEEAAPAVDLFGGAKAGGDY